MPIPRALLLALLLAPPLLAGDWTNAGGDAARNGQTDEVGPVTKTLAWSGGRPSIIAWQPVTSGSRVFMVRQTDFVPTGVPNEAPVVCQDLDKGAELWTFNTPYVAGDWTPWIAGCSNGLVYCSRSGNGGSVASKLYALDQKTGAVVWVSADSQKAGAYDGVVFAPDGDPIVAWHQKIRRFDAETGATVWSADRLGSVSGNCGVALHGDAVYAADAAVGGHVIKRFDLATGVLQYQSPVMVGFTLQNTPFVAPDGTVYLSRTQNNLATDFFYSFTDTGVALLQNWFVPAAWSTSSEFAVGLDGSPYMLGAGNVLQRLDPLSGAVTATSVTIQAAAGNVTPRLAVDAAGHVFAGNGGGSGGKVFGFDADLQTLWSLDLPNVNIGAPCLGQDGTLIVAGTGTDVRAYRTGLPWTDVQQGLAGAAGTPELSGTGTLQAGSPVTLILAEAAPLSAAYLFAGPAEFDVPFKGGTLVPGADVLIGPLATDAQGRLVLSGTWPAGMPSGTQLWLQEWIVDAGGPKGFAASNGLRATTP
ncbi:MAG TPA: PQQ-binding-like beta-propeller repeat protein [Planctomycetota bacterium]|nr:PQQ-binding-like beta-propeller repeat protein [Planctomycetota bacterium]